MWKIHGVPRNMIHTWWVFHIFCMFTARAIRRSEFKHGCATSFQVLLPFQAMILFGLAGLPSLPLPMFSYVFSKMDFLENYSYCAAG